MVLEDAGMLVFAFSNTSHQVMERMKCTLYPIIELDLYDSICLSQ